jgi:hypothetical protein
VCQSRDITLDQLESKVSTNSKCLPLPKATFKARKDDCFHKCVNTNKTWGQGAEEIGNHVTSKESPNKTPKNGPQRKGD